MPNRWGIEASFRSQKRLVFRLSAEKSEATLHFTENSSIKASAAFGHTEQRNGLHLWLSRQTSVIFFTLPTGHLIEAIHPGQIRHMKAKQCQNVPFSPIESHEKEEML